MQVVDAIGTNGAGGNARRTRAHARAHRHSGRVRALRRVIPVVAAGAVIAVAALVFNPFGAAIPNVSVGLSREAGELLKRITRSVKDIESMNEQIACAAEQQGTAGEEISRSVTNVRDISEQTAAASEETASSSTELARIGVRLQEMTRRFQV